MTGESETTTVAQLSTPDSSGSPIPAVLTRLVWLLWGVSLGVLGMFVQRGALWEVDGLVVVDGLTVTMWATVTFFSGIVHSYSRRYMAGSATIDGFFARVFAFTLTVMALVAADSLALFVLCWALMGLVMAELIGTTEGWPQARAAASVARRYFLGGTAALAVAAGTLWYHTGTTTVSGLASSVETASTTVVVLAAGGLLLAAMAQSALVPFHTWLLSSMTAPTPASALMHAGFVNAGGILLVRFAPVVTVEAGFMLVVVLVGATSALLGKLLKTVQTDVKTKLGCSTVGQMGFMIMQVGLGFFAAAITHLILHGFYKAYQFLSSGARVSHESPAKSNSRHSPGVAGGLVVAGTALAGGLLFAGLTGKGTKLDTGLLLTLLVVVTVLHAARELASDPALPTGVRYGAVPLVALPAIAVYAGIYEAMAGLLSELPAVGQPAELTAVHVVVAVAFAVAYLAIDRGFYQRSRRLYVFLVNASQPATETLLTTTEEYNEY
ncbi:proton-conducting transporter transmembrane domain-containing protein [Halovenus salina]|uniref:Proton-conducting transporter membrane subunit n=1 Tax=Halovenus salina TaxID=1510225 RepID=A0ABD5WA81_9EURY|nr:proton-conducting transporter membrane subunit [Halovenus salina]